MAFQASEVRCAKKTPSLFRVTSCALFMHFLLTVPGKNGLPFQASSGNFQPILGNSSHFEVISDHVSQLQQLKERVAVLPWLLQNISANCRQPVLEHLVQLGGCS